MGKENDHSKYANWIDPADCIPYERNAKEHTEKQVSNIANSIRRFGWQQDVVITSDNVLVIGHGRRLAAIKLGCQMPYHMIDKQADELTDKDIRELRIADNQTNSETGYDFTMYSDSGGSANGKAIYFASSVKSSADYASGKNNTMMRAKLTGGKSISYYSAQSMYNSALSRGDKLAKACSQADYKSSANLYALAKGYDIVTSSDYCMVLNRRCLTVSDKTMKNVTYGTKVWH